jgi:hypothetical protein
MTSSSLSETTLFNGQVAPMYGRPSRPDTSAQTLPDPRRAHKCYFRISGRVAASHRYSRDNAPLSQPSPSPRERLAALTPRPEINLVLYHGALASHARWRAEVVAYRRAESDEATGPCAAAGRVGPWALGGERTRYWTWAALMRRAFDLDVLRCPRCAGRMHLIATIDDPAVIQKILAHLGLPGAREDPRPLLPLTAAGAEQPALPSKSV